MEELLSKEQSLHERLFPYKLNFKERLHGVLVVGIVMGLFLISVSPAFDINLRLPSITGHPIEDLIQHSSGSLTLIAVGIIGIYLLASFIKSHALYIELKAYRDIYETLRWAELKDIFLDELFNLIRLVKFNGISEMFYSGPQNPSLVAALNACEFRSEFVDTEIDGVPIKDLTIHSIYKLASKRELQSINIMSKADKEYECEANICLRFKFKDDQHDE